METNRIVISGELMDNFVLDHKVRDEQFFSNFVQVKRQSGYCDELPMIVSDKLLRNKKFAKGDTIYVIGQLRSINKIVDGKNKLLKRVFVTEILEHTNIVNEVNLIGHLCTKPVYRITPLGREICEIVLAVNRPYDKSDYIHCIAWGRNAKFVSTMAIGDKVQVDGRFQSRIYKKELQTGACDMTAYEVSVQSVALYNDEAT